ncbi:Mn superoxide dismutase [Pholiota molesta]|nr:Mn superoxide dismutase [Pholiota molesta]
MLSIAKNAYKHTLPPLPYAYDVRFKSLDVAEKRSRTIHRGRNHETTPDKHHQTYVNGLNAAERHMLKPTQRQAHPMQSALKFNGGGHINHSLCLEKALISDFGSVEQFKTQMNAATAAIQGSGWGGSDIHLLKKLEIVTTANQDPLSVSHVPIIGIDIWEHYLNAIWNVINFEEAEARLVNASK